jgi:hypothetical protein
MLLIKNFSNEALGDVVCKIMNEELKIQAFFDYVELTDEEVLFRWLLPQDCIDITLSDMIKSYKTIDFLVVNLLAMHKAKKQKMS